jgi:hypothetical protein
VRVKVPAASFKRAIRDAIWSAVVWSKEWMDKDEGYRQEHGIG